MKTAVRLLTFVTVLVALGAPATASAAPKPPTLQLQIQPGGSFRGHNGYVAYAANERGDIVGAIEVIPSSCCTGPHHAAAWRSGVLQDIGTLGGIASEARGIDRRGRIVGWSLRADGTSWAFLWTDGAMRPLWPGAAYGINDRGDIVGRLDSPAGSRPALFRDNKLMPLPTVGGIGGEALAITDSGNVIVGWSRNAFGVRAATRWGDGQARPLWLGVANGVNKHGTVVGATDCAFDEFPCAAVIWRGGPVIPLGGDTVAAYGINDAGVVVGAPAFRWSDSELSPLPGIGSPDFSFGKAFAVTKHGDIVGAVGFIDQAALWR